MAEINTGDLITNAKFVEEFNKKIWNGILSGALYGGQASDVKVANTANGTQVTIKGAPKYTSVRTYGKTGNRGAVYNMGPYNVIPSGELTEISAGQDLGITLNAAQFKDKLINASDLYNACLKCVQSLVYIRPFRGMWQHDGETAGTEYFPSSTTFAYGHFKKAVCTGNTVNIGNTDNWNNAASVSRWVNSKGTSINITSVIMRGVQEGIVVSASDSSSNLNELFNLWKKNCFNTNAFYYRLYTCHANCHASCHGRGRSRR